MKATIDSRLAEYRAGKLTLEKLRGELKVLREEFVRVKDVAPRGIIPEGRAGDMRLTERTVELGVWMQDTFLAMRGDRAAADRLAVYKASMAEGTDAGGGILVPDELQRTVWFMLEGASVILPDVTQFQMNSDVKKVPGLSTRLSVAWHKEADTIAAGEPTFAGVTLNAKRIDAICTASNELMQDSSIAMVSMLLELFTDAGAQAVDSAIFNGNASAEFSGIFSTTAGKSAVFSTGSTNFSAILATNMIDAYVKVPSYYREPGQGRNLRGRSGKFYMHSEILAYLAKEKDAGGHWLWPPYSTLEGSIPGVHGYPIVESHQCPDAAATGVSKACAVFGVPRCLFVGDRAQASTLLDPYTQAATYQTRIVFVMRLALGWGDVNGFSRIVTAAS